MIHNILDRGGYSIYKHCLVWDGPAPDETKLTGLEAKHLLFSRRDAWMLRNIYDWDCSEETNFWFIIKDNYSENDYTKKTRKYIEKANTRFEYKIIDVDTYRKNAYDVYEAAFSHYRVNDGSHQSRDEFEAGSKNIGNNVDIWGAIDRETGRIEAYSICKRSGNIINFQTSKGNPEFLPKYYIMYGLYDARNRYYFNTLKVKIVISSARSITEHSNIQNFLIEKFAFRRAYCRIQIFYKPWFAFFIKLLFPFRKIISNRKIAYLLRMEAMNRGFL